VTIDPGTDMASMYTMPASTLSTNRVITLGVTGTLYAGTSTVWVARRDTSANTLTIQNGGPGGAAASSLVIPGSLSTPVLVGATYNGTDWIIHTFLYTD
jgi:hypothetical protein